MKKNVVREEREVQKLQERVKELEQQLAEAQATIRALSSPGGADVRLDNDRQRAEELNAIIQALHDPVLVYDQNGVISMANASAMRAHGFDPTQHHRRDTNQTLKVRNAAGEFVDSDDLPSAHALKGETIIDEALTITNSNGQELSILVSAGPLIVKGVQTGAVSVWHDITDQVKAEEAKELALAQAEQGNLLLEALMEFIPEGICITGGAPDFSIKRISHYGLEMTGNLDASRIVGVPAGQHQYPLGLFLADGVTQSPPEETPLYRAGHFGEIIFNEEMVIRTQDGVPIPILMSAAPIRNAQGQIVAAINSWRDFTAIKRLQENLRTTRDQALWLARLPGENPNPVVRVSDAGIVLYHNAAAANRQGWTCVLHEPLPMPLRPLVQQALTQGHVVDQDVSLDGRTYSVSVVPILEEGYANLYGQDITERKRVESALAESERRQREISRLLELDQARLAAVLQHLPVGVWIADETGKLVNKNAQADRIWAGEAPLSESVEEYRQYMAWHPHSGKLLRPEEYPIAVALQTGMPVQPMELKIRRFDGSEGTVLVSAAPIKDGQGRLTGVVGTNVDITEHKQSEIALRKRESTLTLAGEMAHLGAWDIELEKLEDINANPLAWSDEVYRIFGYAPGEVEPSNELFFERVHPEDRTLVQENVAQALAARQPYKIEHRIRRPDGKERIVQEYAEVFFDEEGKPTRIVGAVQDITERKHAEEALREAEIKYRTLVENIPNAVTYMDSLDPAIGTFYVSPQIETMLGYTVEEWQENPRSWHEHLHPEDRDRVLASDIYYETSDEPFSTEYRMIARDGRTLWVHDEAVVIRDSAGKPQFSQGIMIDITQRKQAEEALLESRRRINDILISLGDGLFALDKEWSIIYVNQHAVKIAERPANELVGKNLWTLWPQLIGSPLETIYRQAMDQRISGQVRMQGVQSGRWYDVSVYPSSEGITIFYVDKTEQILAEERFNKAFHSGPSASVISRTKDGRIETVNNRFLEFFGYDKQEVIGKTSTALHMFRNPADRQEAIRKLQENGSIHDFELDVQLKSGEVRNVSLSTELLSISGENLMLTTILDITERKQAEQALRESEQRLKRAQEIAHLGSWELDLLNNQLTWSDEVYRIFGMQPQEFEATYEAFLAAVHPDDRAAVDAAYSGSIQSGKDSYEIEHRVVKQSTGEVRIVHEKCEHFRNEEGQVVRSIGMVHDITERKKAEQALRESEQRFHSLADSMPQLVWTARPDGTVDYYNQRYQEYKEIKQVEAEAWEWAPVLHPDDLQKTVTAWQHSLETGEIYQIEHRVRMANGSYRWHLSRGIPMLDDQGKILHWFGTATDIHDLKMAEDKLKEYAERLERSNRELEQFAFMASHDLQEPLRKIEMFGDLLLERATSLNQQERDYLDRMQNAAGRMRDMVEGLLQLSRVTTQGKPFIPVNLSEVVSAVVSDLEGQIQRVGGKVEFECLPVVEGDPLQLRQLMQNLIGNALKYHRPDTPPEVKIHVKDLPEQVQILVEDNGIGFDPADVERIFQPFQRLVGRSQYEGTGIGLSICRRIVEQHSGEITALSTPGQGTTFIITLPISHPKSATDESRKDSSNEKPTTPPGR